jgi:histidine triad (HIT) family protein
MPPQDHGQGQQQSIFYRLANGDIPSKTVFQNKSFRAILDKQPAAPGHILIIPKEQVQITPQFTPEMNADLAEAIKQSSHALLKGLDATGTSVFIANGGVAGQNAPQSLIHVIPREEHDSIGLKPQPQRIDDEAFDEAANRLKAALGVSDDEARHDTSQETTPEESEHEPRDENDVDLDSVQDKFL